MKKKAIIISISLFALLAVGFTAYENVYLKIGQNIDVFGRVYKEIVSRNIECVGDQNKQFEAWNLGASFEIADMDARDEYDVA